LTCKGLGKVKDIKCVCGNIIDTNMVKVRRNHRPECPWCGKALGGQYDNYGMPQIY